MGPLTGFRDRKDSPLPGLFIRAWKNIRMHSDGPVKFSFQDSAASTEQHGFSKGRQLSTTTQQNNDLRRKVTARAPVQLCNIQLKQQPLYDTLLGC
jgi:hypothetical protein